MQLDREQVEQALERATRFDAERDDDSTFDLADVERLGDELGLFPEAVRNAVVEISGQASGMLTVGARGFVPDTVPAVQESLNSYLHLRGLVLSAPGMWRQQGGWWPDLYRFTAVSPVAVTVTHAGQRAFVSLTAGLDRLFRAHVVAAVLGVITAVLIFFSRPGAGQLLTLTALLGGWLVADLWAFMRRRAAIEQRLIGAVEAISLPEYRSQPW